MDEAKAVWNMISEGARFSWLESQGFIQEQCRMNCERKFEHLADSIQELWINRGDCPSCGKLHAGSCDDKVEVNLWTTITAVQVICEFQKVMTSKELGAAVIYRLLPLIGEIATQFELPYDCPEVDEEIVDLAVKVGWA